jgi:hypothetical protein
MNIRKYAAALALAAAVSGPPALLSSQGATTPGAGATDSGSADVAVLLDLSQSVLPYFQDVTDYVVSSVVRDYLRSGDSFHLLSFGETAQVEIAQRMSSEEDVKSVLGRLYLLYPLARYTDFAGALGYLYQYLADLPSSRPKVVVIITDGIHNPPAASPTYGLPDDKVAADIEATAARIRANGWPVHIIKLPFAAEDAAKAGAQARDSEGRSFLDAAAKALDAPVSEFRSDGKEDLAVRTLGIPTAEFPGDLGKRDYAFTFPVRVANGSDAPVGLELTGAFIGGEDVLGRKSILSLPPGKSGTLKVSVVLPDSMPEGEQSLRVELGFANGVRVSPREGTLSLTLERSPFGAIFRSGARIILFVVIFALGLAAVAALLLMLRGAGRRAQAPVLAAVLGASAGAETGTAPAEDASILGASAARSEADRRARESEASGSAAAMVEARRAAAKRDAEMLAAAARPAEALPAKAEAVSPARAALAASDQARDREEYESSVRGAAEAIAAERRAAAKRDAELLASALPRRAPAAQEGAERARVPAIAYESRIVKPGEARVELRVEDQNPYIGLRNVHSLRAGSSKTIGGGASDFLVFLVRVPRRVADLHFDGEKLTFVPRRREFFPEVAGPVENCLGVDIPMVSSSGYPLILRFEPYEEPAKTINRLLHCIDVPGLF